MSLIILLLLLAPLCGHAAVSEKSCQALGLNPSSQGSNLICATSRADYLGLKDCGVRKSWIQAQDTCLAIGMRLCTSAELTADEALNSGCSLESERVWTRTGCFVGDSTRAISQAGSSKFLPTVSPNCTRFMEPLGVRCCADVFACQSNECSESEDPANICVPTATGHQCVCGSSYIPGPNRNSCDKIVDTPRPSTGRPTIRPTVFPTSGSPCTAKPCSEDKDARNRCFTQPDRTYQCSCQGFRFKDSPDRQSCTYVPDSCFPGACLSTLSRRNVCTDNLDGTFTCSCDSPRFRVSDNGNACLEQSDPCVVGDPCAIALSPGNVCVSKPDGTFQCECNGDRFYAVSPTSCRRRSNPCANNPCSTVQDVLNQCVENGDADNTYTCQCRGQRYRNADNGQSCVLVPLPCDTHNCRLEHPGNLCVGKSDGTQYCRCEAVGWQASEDQQSCVVRTSPCRTDPCLSTKNERNSCIDFRNGTYRCMCAPNYYIVSLDGFSCLSAPNYCITSDPCMTRYKGNKCVYSCEGEKCTHTCQCLDGWMNVRDSSGRDTCERTPQPCLTDPCLRREEVKNTCIDVGGGRWTCQCGGARYRPKYDDDEVAIIGCEKTEDFCSSPQAVKACATSVLGNLCVDTSSSFQQRSFQCTCSALGWTKASTTECSPPPNKCQEGGPGGYCSVKDDATGIPLAGNQCIDNKDGSYSCICLQSGWNPNYGSQKCIPPANFCTRMVSAGQDACLARVSGASNSCVDLKNGTYTCVCDALHGYKSVIGGQRCEAPTNGCLKNPCLQSRDPLNTCLNRADGSWLCTCGGYDYIPDPDQPTGTACKFQLHYNECYNYTLNPLNIPTYDPKDPCRMAWNPDNSCFDRRKDNGHECICRNGFTNGTVVTANGLALWCLAPANICAGTSDPCRILNGVNKYNFCVYDGNGQFHCECATRGFMAAQDGRSCRPVVNPCNSNPCTTVAKNTCNSTANDGTYTCSCLAPGWLNTQGNQRCVQTANLCLYNDPCSTRLNRRNQCRSFPSYYECNCLGRGWTTSLDKQSCVAPTNACLQNNDVCQSQFHSLNYCVDHKDGTYHCDCGAEGFDPSPNNQNCTCRSPCLLGDPCNVNENSNNSCTVLAPGDSQAGNLKDPTNCGIFKCTCSLGWLKVVTLWGTERCQPPDPCNRYDPCSSSFNSGNVCINGYDGASTQYNPLSDPLNPVNVAIRSTAGQPVRPLPSYNTLSNYNSNTDYPLNLLSNPQLQGVFLNQAPSNYDFSTRPTNYNNGYYIGRRLLAVDPVKHTAYPLPKSLALPTQVLYTRANPPKSIPIRPKSVQNTPLSNDDVPMRRSRLDPGDASTVFYTVNSYFCQCEAPGWSTPLGAQSCLPPNRCSQGDPCATAKDYLNTCTPGTRAGTPGYSDVLNDPYIVNLTPNGYGADYSCNCGGHGWYPSSDHRFCLPCANPCKAASDPCNTARWVNNSCLWEFDEQPSLRRQADAPMRRQGGLAENGGGSSICGRFLCICDYRNAWVSAQKGQTCVKCSDSCAGDPCKSVQDPLNNCTNVYPPNAANVNYGGNETAGESDFSGPILANNFGFVQVLNAVAQDKNLANPCGLYKCQCNAPTWLPTQNENSCVRCIDPCSSSDPCRRVASGFRNQCTALDPTSEPVGGVGRRLLQLNANSYSNLATFGEFCGPYVCTCGVGYVAIAGATQCTACIDPCIAVRTRDPCRVANGNICTVAPTGSTTPGPGRRLLEQEDYIDEVERRQAAVQLPACGDFLCICNPPNFVVFGTQRCVANCINQCASGADPCMTQNSTRNSCAYVNAAFGEDCGHHRCTCGPGFQVTFGNQGCILPGAGGTPRVGPGFAPSPATSAASSPATSAPSPSLACPVGSDPCVTKQAGNKCVPQSSSFTCTCGNSRYTPGPDGRSCELKCTNPAQLTGITLCKVNSVTRNVCYVSGSAWNCICNTGSLRNDGRGPMCA